MKDKRAFIFYFLMTIILLDFGEQLRKLLNAFDSEKISNFLFSISHVNNSGGAFGIFQNNYRLFAVIAIVVVIFILFYVIKNITYNDKIELLCCTLFSAGALGNALERLRFNYVFDYIKLNFINFPIFNAFDIMISVSVIMYFIFVISKAKKVNKI